MLKCQSLFDYQSYFYLEKLDLHRIKHAINLCFQFLLFVFLSIIGCVYSFNARLFDIKTIPAAICSNLSDMPCSLQLNINISLLKIKFLLLYYLLIIIAMIYIWHRTVRFSYCVITFSIIADIIFRTDLVLYFDQINYITFKICIGLVMVFASLESFMPHNNPDPLLTFCEQITSPNYPHEFLLDGHSKRARFYRWVKKIKKKWNVKEEKLIITAIAGVTASIFVIFLNCCIFPYFLTYTSLIKTHSK